MYKAKLQEKIAEKKERADRIKEQQRRIADAMAVAQGVGGGAATLRATLDPFRSTTMG